MLGYKRLTPFNRIRALDRVKNTTTNFKNLGYSIIKNLLIYPDTDLSLVLIESLRNHIVISYFTKFCNYCLKIQPMIDKVSLNFSKA